MIEMQEDFVRLPGVYHITSSDGEYVKYNSNSGFVDVHACRQTPQANSKTSVQIT
jgi:hypothetical protein